MKQTNKNRKLTFYLISEPKKPQQAAMSFPWGQEKKNLQNFL